MIEIDEKIIAELEEVMNLIHQAYKRLVLIEYALTISQRPKEAKQ